MLGRDGWAGGVCLLGSLWLLLLTRGLPQPALVPIGPGFYPRIVLAVTAVLSAVLIGTDLLARRRSRPARAAPGVPRNYRLVWITFGIFTAYVLLLPALGYRLATFLFVLAIQLALEPEVRRHWIRILVIALASAVLTHFVFERWLSVLLPRSRWLGGL
ncbi:MAG TPA: tripartite tricarboxylate transporter TctB family protein [Methylomirabilota bacterium]|nr:tripartite tricarboxylate transporter TctB family protein [Methylomirabilota bacterium]